MVIDSRCPAGSGVLEPPAGEWSCPLVGAAPARASAVGAIDDMAPKGLWCEVPGELSACMTITAAATASTTPGRRPVAPGSARVGT